MLFRDLVCVVVLYRRLPKQSEALEGLRSFFQAERAEGNIDHEDAPIVVVYDNSPTPASLELNEWDGIEVTYRHNPANPGLAEAYNTALNTATLRGRKWLLLLDQDTRIPAPFLRNLLEKLHTAAPPVCAIVPRLRHGHVEVSPVIRGLFRETLVDSNFEGIHQEDLMVLNSGACLRVSALLAIGGFPLDYPLDYLDHILFFRLQKSGGKLYVLSAVLQHQLSLMELRSEMSLARYERMLSAEKRFMYESRGRHGERLLRLRLFKRAWSQLIAEHSIKHSWMTLTAALKQGRSR